MKKSRKGFKDRLRESYNRLRAKIIERMRTFQDNVRIRFWNFRVKLPNLALFAPLIGALITLIIGVYLLVIGFHVLHPDEPITLHNLLPDFYSNIITTLIDIAITVLIVDWLNRIRDDRLEKIRLLRDIGCGDHGIALRAVQDITQEDLHQKGFLRHRMLLGANLAGAVLGGADLSHSSFHDSNFTGVELYGARLYMTCFWCAVLRGADLRDADLNQTDFIYADLTDALVTIQQLRSAYRLHGARLPNGKIYDGRFSLLGDIEDAQISGVDTNNQVEMAKWYAMPYDQFMRSMDLRKEKPELTDWDNW